MSAVLFAGDGQDDRAGVRYRSRTYDNRAVTGLDGAELADTPTGGVQFYRTPRGTSSMISQTRTPRRVRMRAGTVEHLDRYGNVSRFRIVECIRTESMGAHPTLYGWRACAAVVAYRIGGAL